MNTSSEAGAFFAGLLLGISLGSLICGVIVKTAYQREAIDNSAAQYDEKTGEWEWIKPEEKPEAPTQAK